MASKKKNILGIAPPFYSILILLAMLGLGYMALLGVPTDNIGMITVALIFGFLFVVGYNISRESLSKTKEPLTVSSQGFFVGFMAWFVVTNLYRISSYFSALIFPPQATLASLQAQIPPFWGFFTTVIWAPIIEELFFGIALPLLIFDMFGKMSKEFKILGNVFLQFVVVLIIASFGFAAFHTSATQVGFFIAAMLFRAIQVLAVFGDRKFDIVPRYVVPYSFLVGTHMANNLSSYGVVSSYNILMTNIAGQITLLLFVGFLVLGFRGFLFRK